MYSESRPRLSLSEAKNEMAAETVCRVWSRFVPISVTESLIFRRRPSTNALGLPCRHSFGFPSKSKSRILSVEYRVPSRIFAAAGWFSGFGGKKKPEIVKAGDPVLHEPAADVPVADIGSQRIEEIIEDMIAAMRNSPGVGLAAPQIGVPLNIIVLEDTKQYISYAPRKEIEMQDRRSFDLLVILNPKLKKKGTKTALFFEGCLRWI